MKCLLRVPGTSNECSQCSACVVLCNKYQANHQSLLSSRQHWSHLIILFTISSEAFPSYAHCPLHTYAPPPPTNPTSGCSSLMKEKITPRQSGSHTKMPALHSAFSSTKYFTRCHWHYLKWLHLAEVNVMEQHSHSHGTFSPFDNIPCRLTPPHPITAHIHTHHLWIEPFFFYTQINTKCLVIYILWKLYIWKQRKVLAYVPT